jgi:chitinase
MINKLLLISILLLGISPIYNSTSAQKIIAGYYESWTNLPAPYEMEFNNLTHVIQAFVSPNADGSINIPGGIYNPNLVAAVHRAGKKIIISFCNDDSLDTFGTVSADSALRRVFISNVVQFLSTYHYDGVDIDWEFPNARQSGSLTNLIKQLRQKFTSTDSTWLITMAVPSGAFYGQFYQYESMLPYIDWFAIMGYDFHGSWSSYTGHNAPLYQSPKYPDGDDAGAVKYMNITRRIPLNKLLLGVPFYGRKFNSKGLYQPFKDSVIALTYADIMDTVSGSKWIYNWDSVSSVPYYTNSDSTEFITFDDTTSIRLKTEYALANKLGGMMIWALDQDLINGQQPLLETIGKVIENSTTDVVSNHAVDAAGFYLYNNYPNPFNPTTNIDYQLPRDGRVKLTVYDVLGNEIKKLVDGYNSKGRHSVSFNASNLASGIYFYQLISNGFFATGKMLLLK